MRNENFRTYDFDFGENSDKMKISIFVEWTINGKRRGCVGCFTSLPIFDALREYSITSTMKDWRFSPIALSEISKSECTVHVLHTFEDSIDVDDWEMGIHGLRLYFNNHESSCLPYDTKENEAIKSKVDVIKMLLENAGYKGEFNDRIASSIILKRFQTSSATATFKEFQQFIQRK